MKKLVISLVVISFVCAGAAQAQLGPVAVENYSFELPGTDKLSNWTDVPGWSSDTVASDSGVEENAAATDGDWIGYLRTSYTDPSVWQLTGHEIVAGEVFELKIDATNTWNGSSQPADIKLTLYYDNGDGVRNVGNSMPFTLPTVSNVYQWDEYTIQFDAGLIPASAGSMIGIEIENNMPLGDSCWLGMDNVRLDVVPEPATMMLLGLGSLALLKRRRA